MADSKYSDEFTEEDYRSGQLIHAQILLEDARDSAINGDSNEMRQWNICEALRIITDLIDPPQHEPQKFYPNVPF